MLLGNTSAAALPAAGSAFASANATAGTVRLSIRKPSGDYVKVEVGEQTLIAELKAELSGITGMPLRTQVRPLFAALLP